MNRFRVVVVSLIDCARWGGGGKRGSMPSFLLLHTELLYFFVLVGWLLNASEASVTPVKSRTKLRLVLVQQCTCFLTWCVHTTSFRKPGVVAC